MGITEKPSESFKIALKRDCEASRGVFGDAYSKSILTNSFTEVGVLVRGVQPRGSDGCVFFKRAVLVSNLC